MFDLPASTHFGKRVPKQRFYENLSVSPQLKRVFVEQIESIVWEHKLAASTLNVQAGDAVQEVEIMVLHLRQKGLPTTVLERLDREIPYHILFLLEYAEEYQAWIGYKRASAGASPFKVDAYYHTDWYSRDALPLEVQGLTLDAIYENLVRQIAGEHLQTADAGEEDAPQTLRESVQRAQQRQKLQARIDRLTRQIYREKQFNRQMELNAELRKLRVRLSNIGG